MPEHARVGYALELGQEKPFYYPLRDHIGTWSIHKFENKDGGAMTMLLPDSLAIIE